MPTAIIRAAVAVTLAVTVASGGVCAQPAGEPATRAAACEWCGAPDAPAALTSEARLAPRGEPGTSLVVTGIVYRPDGRTPAPGVLVYAYHTNAAGAYPRRGGETGAARQHGYLRGWLRTDAQGRYRLTTIRPAPYPGRDSPAHIHLTVTPPGGEERWIDSVVFDDDPLLTTPRRAALENLGGSGIVQVTRGPDDILRATRDIVLAHWP